MPARHLIEKIYAEIVVGCTSDGCKSVFIATEPASNPAEAWAMRAATEAESKGWRADACGHVFCAVCSLGSEVK